MNEVKIFKSEEFGQVRVIEHQRIRPLQPDPVEQAADSEAVQTMGNIGSSAVDQKTRRVCHRTGNHV